MKAFLVLDEKGLRIEWATNQATVAQCAKCGGTGFVDIWDGAQTYQEICLACEGRGEIRER